MQDQNGHIHITDYAFEIPALSSSVVFNITLALTDFNDAGESEIGRSMVPQLVHQ